MSEERVTLLGTGYRKLTITRHKAWVWSVLDALCIPPGSLVVEGACSGADDLIHLWAKSRGHDTARFPIDRVLDGEWPAAGPHRNERMILAMNPTLGVAFHLDAGLGRGTKNCVGLMRAYKIPHSIHIYQGDTSRWSPFP